ncbi:RNA-binding S4 domain-containing protein [Rhodobacteraceae bacterium PA1-206B]
MPRIRIDKWLWQARFFKSRGLAAELVQGGHLRINGTPVSRPSREVGLGDVLTFPQGRNIRLIRIVGTGVRRGPATEAQTLFIDLDAPPVPPPPLE